MAGFPKVYPTHAVMDRRLSSTMEQMVFYGSFTSCRSYITANYHNQLELVSFGSLNILF